MSESSESSEKSSLPSWIRINPPVFIISAVLIVIAVIFTISFPEIADSLFASIQQWILDTAGWFYVAAVAGFLVFVVYLAVSEFGKIKLGPEHSEPDYSYLSWFAMLFSAGMGIGLMFFAVAEPVMHFMTPPVGEGNTVEAARQAMRITFFHWGVHAWAIYAVVALSLAYFAFRHGLPLTIRSALYPLIGERIYGPIGNAVDIFAVLGTLFGVATSLGFGVIQVNAGLNYLFELPITPWVQVGLIAIITSFATLSVCLGLDSGIKRISELNIFLAILLLLFVLIAGPTLFLLQTFVQNTGTYIAGLVESTFNLYAYEPTGWIGGWTLFYWGWWIAWSPFVGMFIARVSRGRTIREFIVGVLMVPTGFTFLWMTLFGDTAIHMIMDQGLTELADTVMDNKAVALFQFFHHLPMTTIVNTLATLLVVTFFVTSSDSGSLVVDMLTSGGDSHSPVWQRVFWAVTEGLVAAVLLLNSGLNALQTATIACALPFTIIMVFMCWGLLHALRMDVAKRFSIREARVTPIGNGTGTTWQNRLKKIVHHPGKAEVDRFINETVRPAFQDVCKEFAQQNIEAHFKEAEDGRLWVEVHHGDEVDFHYLARARRYEPPSFVFSDFGSRRNKERNYYRVEVHFKEGGQDYDIMGWSKTDVINDVVDQYERHLHFLHTVR